MRGVASGRCPVVLPGLDAGHEDTPFGTGERQHRPGRILRVPHGHQPSRTRDLNAATFLRSAVVALPPGSAGHLNAVAFVGAAVAALAPCGARKFQTPHVFDSSRSMSIVDSDSDSARDLSRLNTRA